MEVDARSQHKEVLALIKAENDAQSSTLIRGKFIAHGSNSSLRSLLPPYPKIFHGRDAELHDVVSILLQDTARVAILGTGGMGKTTLATAVLHHPEITSKYLHLHFVSCDSAMTGTQLVEIVGSYIGLEPSRRLSTAILDHLSKSGPTLLLLDNFETPWEGVDSRREVEEFLSLLNDLPGLALLITMRGAERPGKVKWTRPFLPPLEPLALDASRKTFVEIADEPPCEEEPALVELIELTGNLPLAVGLMANVASVEGYTGALSRWKQENFALISDGYDRRSNLEKSFIISLTSPRMRSTPAAMELLSILSVLPDGIADADLLLSGIPIPKILECKSLLLRMSLAFVDRDRLKALTPIWEYISRVHPPSASLTKPIRRHWRNMLEMWKLLQTSSYRDVVLQLQSNIGNIESFAALESGTSSAETVDIILALSTFARSIVRGSIQPVKLISAVEHSAFTAPEHF
ncbi:P-loop containing nucleoside triphosphate hydrolase protein [Mycena rebaudengoi]|nr:P-loop containing nucleoside triphosphate hydrolase protein [Mycena rebaudengoi]